MRPLALLLLTVSLFVSLPAPAAAQSGDEPAVGELIAPAFRAERHFEAGRRFLESLPAGTVVTLDRADGAQLALDFDGEAFHTQLEPSRFEPAEKRIVTPLGYRLEMVQETGRSFYFLRITAPNGTWTELRNRRGQEAIASESDGIRWIHRGRTLALRVGDGTRIDFTEEHRRIDVLTMLGERFRVMIANGVIEQLKDSPAPPTIPDIRALYLSGNGDDWRMPAHEDHVVFAWGWYPYPLKMKRLIKEVGAKPRRHDLDYYFNGVERVQEPIESGACLIARRFGLVGGDRVTITLPDADPHMVFVLPGPLEPDYSVPFELPREQGLFPLRTIDR